MDIKSAVQRQFSNAAAHYTTSAVHASGADLAAMVEAAQLRGDERVLDAGCGAGHTAFAFAPHVRAVIAYDLAPPMLEQVQRSALQRGLRNITIQQGDVEALPFDQAAFDLVVSRFSAHHWPHPDRALSEIARVLKSGSAFILSDVISPEDPTRDTFLQTIELLRDPSHVRDYRISEWQTYFHIAGLQFEVLKTWELELKFAPWIERIGTPEQNAAMIRALFDGAPSEIRSAMRLQPDYTFSIPCALLRGMKQS